MSFIDLFADETTKRFIFEILLADKELTAKQIHNQLCKQYMYSASYQSTFKALKSMLQNKVIKMNGLGYTVDTQWLITQRDRLSKVIDKNLNIDNCVYKSPIMRIYSLENLKKVDNFIQEVVLQLVKEHDIKETHWKSSHCWWLLGYPIEEEDILDEYNKNKLKCYALINGNSSLDQEACDYYRNKKEYISVVTSQSKNDHEIVQVVGDHVILCRLPSLVMTKLHDFYDLPEKERDISILLKIINEPGNYELQVLENKNIAEMYRKQISSKTTTHVSH